MIPKTLRASEHTSKTELPKSGTQTQAFILNNPTTPNPPCGQQVTNCPFATSGCQWRGSAGRLSAHRASCRKQPRSTL